MQLGLQHSHRLACRTVRAAGAEDADELRLSLLAWLEQAETAARGEDQQATGLQQEMGLRLRQASAAPPRHSSAPSQLRPVHSLLQLCLDPSLDRAG